MQGQDCDKELTHFERNLCEAIKCVEKNVGNVVRRLVDKGMLEEADFTAFRDGMARCIADVRGAEESPFYAHLRPEQSEELRAYLGLST